MHVYKGMLEVKAPERVAKCWDGQLARVWGVGCRVQQHLVTHIHTSVIQCCKIR